jgi:hypothetical protein
MSSIFKKGQQGRTEGIQVCGPLCNHAPWHGFSVLCPKILGGW